MISESLQSKVAVVVVSCDKYKDLWPPFFELFFKHWADCPYSIFLFANEQKFSDSRVQTILSGPDRDWSSSVKKCLEQIDSEYVLILFDDVFLRKKVNSEKLNHFMNHIVTLNPNYLKFTPVPRPDTRVNSNVGLFFQDTHYRNGLMSIWKRRVLLDLLVEGESAWNFEINGGFERSKKYEYFYGCYEEYFEFLHGVEKGQWYPNVVQKLTKMGLKIDLEARSVLNGQNHFRSQLSLLKRAIFIHAPVHLRPYLFKASRFVRSKIYKKW